MLGANCCLKDCGMTSTRCKEIDISRIPSDYLEYVDSVWRKETDTRAPDYDIQLRFANNNIYV